MADLPKKSIFYDFLEKNNIETERAKVYYSFTGASGEAVFLNEFSDNAPIVEDGLSTAAIPGISVGADDGVFTSSQDLGSSGLFNGSGAVLVGGEIEYSGWTVFMQVNDLGWLSAVNKPKILFSSMVDDTSTSGFHVGIDGSNHLYFQAPVDYSNNLTTLTTTKEVGGNILLSVAMGNQSTELEMTIHDIPYKKNDTYKFSNLGNIGVGQSTQTNTSKTWRIGNFKYSPSYTSANYSGYSGDIGSFILVSGFVDEAVRNSLAETFFIDSYNPSRETTTNVTRNIKTSTPYLDNVFTGSGVTGQTTELLDTFSYPKADGSRDDIKLYKVEDAIGPLSGQQVRFHESSEQVTEQVVTYEEETVNYNSGMLYSGSKDTVSFDRNLTSSDLIEVYSYITGTDNHNQVASRQGSRCEFDAAHTVEKVNLYRNGLLQSEKSRNLLPTGATMNYDLYGGSGTGVIQLGPEHGIVSGQRYYVDFSRDYVSGGVGSGGAVDNANLGIGETLSIYSTPFDEANLGIGFNEGVKTSGFITAERDGLTVLHSGADGNSIAESNKIANNISFLDIRLDYGGDYVVSADGNSVNSDFYPASPGTTSRSNGFNSTDKIIYDRMTSGTAESKYFVYTGQTRADGVYGKNASNKLVLKSYYLGETSESDDEVFYEPYLNGKKLRSGEHYVLKPVGAEVEQMEFDTTKFGQLGESTGIIHIAPLTSGSKNFQTGVYLGTDSYVQANFMIVDEQVWVEGVRQAKGDQYEIVDASSKRKQGKRVDNNGINSIIYSTFNDDGNIGIGS